MGFYTIYPNDLREPQRLSNPYPFDERGQNLAAVLRDIKSNNPRAAELINDAMGAAVEGVQEYSVSEVGTFLVTRLHHHISQRRGQDLTLDLAQESDGTLRMLGMLTAMYQEPPRSLVALEEPESTIHPGALGVLSDVLQEASLRSQVIITTHSPDLISNFPADVLRVVEKEDGVTRVGPVSEAQRGAIAEKLFSAGELMRIEGLRREVSTP
jgi:predicted ATPase